MCLSDGRYKNYAIVANQHQLVELIYNVQEIPEFPPNEKGEKLEAIEFTDENINLNFWYDSKTQQFYEHELPTSREEIIFDLEEKIKVLENILAANDEYTLELIKNELL